MGKINRRNPDANERHLRELISCLGGWYGIQHEDAGFDLLVVLGGVYIVEVKSSKKAPFTDNELDTQLKVLDADGSYNVIITCQDLLKMLDIDLMSLSINTLWQLAETMRVYQEWPDVLQMLESVSEAMQIYNHRLF